MPSKSLALIWPTQRRSQNLDNNENVTKILKKKNKTKPKGLKNKTNNSNIKMMNRFQFRAPTSSQMMKTTGPSGLGSTTINKPKPKPPPNEDLWGDLDDDFLVQASQAAELIQKANNAKAVVTEEERMEMDDDVLTMFIQEEEKFENLPPPIKPEPLKPVRLRADPIKPKVCNFFKDLEDLE